MEEYENILLIISFNTIKMTRKEHSGAFVPVIQFRGNLPGLKKEPVTLFSGRQSSIQFKNEQNCFRFRRNILNT